MASLQANIVVFSRKKERRALLIAVEIEAESEILIEEIYLEGAKIFTPESRVYCNGFQTWTDSREFAPHERMRTHRWPFRRLGLDAYGDAFFKDYPGGPGIFHGYTYGYVREKESLLFVGSLSEAEGYTLIETDTGKNIIRISRDWKGLTFKGRRRAFSLFVCESDESTAFELYFKALNIKSRMPSVCTGWTSWYNYYTVITEKIILENLRWFEEEKIPIDVFQIDDGYQQAVGDWLKIKKEFPHGMGHIADSIHDRGFRAGLWLAPFVAEKKSLLFQEHRDWFLHDDAGKPVQAGFNPGWSYAFYALDIYNQKVRDYLKEVFDVVLKDWGYDMVKLDFLYAAALFPPKGKSRGEVMADGMQLLRELVKKKDILGCGVPLGPAFGLVDYCRIGSDVALTWEDRMLSWGRYRERVSTINSLVSTVGRHQLNSRVFLNDPDVFLLRSDNCSMSEPEKYTLYLLNNVCGGLLFTSDNIHNYSDEEMHLYRSMFPFREKTIRSCRYNDGAVEIDFTIDGNRYLVFSNLTEETRMFYLPGGLFYVTGGGGENFIEGDIHLTLEPHRSVCCFAVKAKDFCPAGSTGHLFPASEISSFTVKNKQINLRIDKKFCNAGDILIRVPFAGEFRINGKNFISEEAGDGLHIVKYPC